MNRLQCLMYESGQYPTMQCTRQVKLTKFNTPMLLIPPPQLNFVNLAAKNSESLPEKAIVRCGWLGQRLSLIHI